MDDVIRAQISRPYLLRLGIVAAFTLALALWCVYDAMVDYPNQITRANKYIELLNESLGQIAPAADLASRNLAVPHPPGEWDSTRWDQKTTDVLEREVTTANQERQFLQIAWLYQHLQKTLADEIDDKSHFHNHQILVKLRQRLKTILNDSADATLPQENTITQTRSRLDAAWKSTVKANHWPSEIPDEPINPYSVDQQFYMAAGIVPFSLFFMIALLRNRGRWVEGDDSGLRNSSGASLSFAQIEVFDKKRWDKKGIAKIKYNAEGRSMTFVLDDCNYEYQPVRDLVRLVESNIARDQITGGAPEPPLETPSDHGMDADSH